MALKLNSSLRLNPVIPTQSRCIGVDTVGPPLAVRCCHVADDFTDFAGDRRTDKRTDRQTEGYRHREVFLLFLVLLPAVSEKSRPNIIPHSCSLV